MNRTTLGASRVLVAPGFIRSPQRRRGGVNPAKAPQSWGIIRAAALALSSLLTACGDTPAEQVGSTGFAIVGGVVAPSPELDHTGALVRIDRSTMTTSVLCTATLIAPSTAVTAKHCIGPLAAFEHLGDEVAWVRGPNVHSPEQRVRIAATEVPEPKVEGGALGIGFDVALVYLAEPVDVTPAVPVAFDRSLLGASMVTLGYGMPAARLPPDGLRRIGRETVVAVDGLVYEILYGNFDRFLEAALSGSHEDLDMVPIADGSSTADDLQAVYEQTALIEGHEVITRTLPGNTRGCRGDSGGPLLSVGLEGEWRLHGVLSGGPRSARAECDAGQVYATFGPQMFDFIRRAAQGPLALPPDGR
jgi:Trypsin